VLIHWYLQFPLLTSHSLISVSIITYNVTQMYIVTYVGLRIMYVHILLCMYVDENNSQYQFLIDKHYNSATQLHMYIHIHM